MIPEPESAELAAFLRGRALVTSEVGEIELRRVNLRRGASPERGDAVLARLTLLALTEEIRRAVGHLEPARLRSLDAIHLATVLHIRRALDGFVCYEGRLIDAARAAGLSVFAPGLLPPA
ncbi:MAG: PIN domain-containing protein [Thermoleophilia bacterium]|nr:PIN domain-containing protein [Thermoleophilia bacterium]